MASIPNRLLNSGQAEAIYGAMCALNNVAMSDSPMTIEFHDVVSGEPCRVQVSNTAAGLLRVSIGGGLLAREREEYESQAAFATAYALDR